MDPSKYMYGSRVYATVFFDLRFWAINLPNLTSNSVQFDILNTYKKSHLGEENHRDQ